LADTVHQASANIILWQMYEQVYFKKCSIHWI